MCDTLTTKNIPDNKKPKYVYKRVQKVGEGKYISAVMGETLKLNVWKKAPDRSKKKDTFDNGLSLVRQIRRSYKRQNYSYSSSYVEHHDGMWASFKTKKDSMLCDLISNFITSGKDKDKPTYFPTIIVKCEVKGIVHEALFCESPTYLVEYIKVVEELGEPKYVFN